VESFCSVGGICISQYYETGRWFLSWGLIVSGFKPTHKIRNYDGCN